MCASYLRLLIWNSSTRTLSHEQKREKLQSVPSISTLLVGGVFMMTLVKPHLPLVDLVVLVVLVVHSRPAFTVRIPPFFLLRFENNL